MKNYLLTGALLALAAAPSAVSAQAVDPPMNSGALIKGQLPQRPAAAGGQAALARPGVPAGRPNPAYGSWPGAANSETPARGRFSQSFERERSYDNGPGQRVNAPLGPANGFFNNSIPPIGPGNGFFNTLTPPVGPANGFGNPPAPDAGTPNCPPNYIYPTLINPVPVVAGGPPLLGGYYYGNYCDSASVSGAYPSVYSVYSGFPQFIFQPNVIVAGQPDSPVYVTSYQPFAPPTYQVTYNNNYYYVANADRASDLQAGGDGARAALQNAYSADSYQAAFADIAQAWTSGDIQPIRRHLRDADTRISVSLNKKYSYSIASSDFAQITRDALDKLGTVSFEFTAIRKAKNGDVTAFGKHVYLAADTAGTGNADPKTVHVAYTLRRHDDLWYIVAVDSSASDLVPADGK